MCWFCLGLHVIIQNSKHTQAPTVLKNEGQDPDDHRTATFQLHQWRS